MLVPPSDIKKIIDALVLKLSGMYQQDLDNNPDRPEQAASKDQQPPALISKTADEFVAMLQEHMKSNRKYEFLSA